MIFKYKSTKLNSSKYCYVSLTIQLNISHSFTHGYLTMSKRMTDQTVQFSISHLFALGLNVKLLFVSLTIRLFNVISRFFPSAEMQSVYSTVPVDWALIDRRVLLYNLFSLYTNLLLRTAIVQDLKLCVFRKKIILKMFF